MASEFIEVNPTANIQPQIDWESGQIVPLVNRDALNQFESDITAAKLPSQLWGDELSPWETRIPLSKLVVPAKFYDRLENFTAVVLGDALERLITKRPQAVRDIEWARTHTIGFRVLADLHSSGRGVISSVDSQVLIWQRKPGTGHDAFKSFGEYGRIVDKPKRAAEDVATILAISSSVGLIATEKALRKPLMGGFETQRHNK